MRLQAKSAKARRVVAVSVLSGVFAAGAIATAAMAAAAGWRDLPVLSASGVKLSNDGGYYFYPQSSGPGNSGGMRYTGTLRDTRADGNNPFVHAKVEGYGYGPKLYVSGGSGSTRWIDQTVYDPAANRVNYGWVQACTDRGTALPDYCDTSPRLNR